MVGSSGFSTNGPPYGRVILYGATRDYYSSVRVKTVPLWKMPPRPFEGEGAVFTMTLVHTSLFQELYFLWNSIHDYLSVLANLKIPSCLKYIYLKRNTRYSQLTPVIVSLEELYTLLSQFWHIWKSLPVRKYLKEKPVQSSALRYYPGLDREVPWFRGWDVWHHPIS